MEDEEHHSINAIDDHYARVTPRSYQFKALMRKNLKLQVLSLTVTNQTLSNFTTCYSCVRDALSVVKFSSRLSWCFLWGSCKWCSILW